MSSKIRVLTDHTINQIAAGEVIENPASVVKELVENSMDAGATEICVEIKGGGRQLIRVTDNGCGMNQDDALLCLERHATSKIREVDDLFSIGTMGFRGEAIPSIAAISKFTLMTRPVEGESNSVGTMVIVDGGKVIKCCPVACASGTSIEIKSLFFNVPVRKKFQKSPIFDANEICKVLSVLALGNPHVKFELINNEKSSLVAPIGKLADRISSVLGAEFYDAMLPLEATKGECVLEGFIGLPTFTRQNRTGQYLFVNKRAVYSPFISYMIREGYGPAIGSHRHPVFVLNLSMPGNLVDVNVHPQKKEVRIRQEYLLKEMIVHAVEKAMSAGYEPTYFEPSAPVFELPKIPEITFSKFESNYTFSSPYIPSPAPTPKVIEKDLPLPFFEKQQSLNIPKVIATIPSYIIVDPASFDKFGNEGLCLVDQRASHARIIFEKLSTENKDKGIPMQSLLIPYTLHSITLLSEQIELLNSFGISIRECGPHSFLIDAIPQAFGNTDVKEFVEEIAQNLQAYSDKTVHQIAGAASRAAVSRNKRLSFEEAQALLNQLMRCQLPYQCPFGKPTMKWISSDQLSKQFI